MRPKIFRRRIVKTPPLSYLFLFRTKSFWNTKCFFTNFVGTVRLKGFEGKSWHPLVCKKFLKPQESGKPEPRDFLALWDKKIQLKKLYPFPLPKKFRYRSFFEKPKGSPTDFFGILRQKMSDGKTWYPQPLVQIFFPWHMFLKHKMVPHETFRHC